jgi:hypothetical protein
MISQFQISGLDLGNWANWANCTIPAICQVLFQSEKNPTAQSLRQSIAPYRGIYKLPQLKTGKSNAKIGGYPKWL